jgi:hypothetical protein
VDYDADSAKQFYGHGARCFNGRDRHAIVSFECGSSNELVDVTEYEVRKQKKIYVELLLHVMNVWDTVIVVYSLSFSIVVVRLRCVGTR